MQREAALCCSRKGRQGREPMLQCEVGVGKRARCDESQACVEAVRVKGQLDMPRGRVTT